MTAEYAGKIYTLDKEDKLIYFNVDNWGKLMILPWGIFVLFNSIVSFF